VLAGVQHDQYPVAEARDLAARVPVEGRAVAIAQASEALEQLDAALKLLPKTTPNREVEGTTNKSDAADARATLRLTLAHLRQPELAASIDALLTPTNKKFRYATLADTGVSQRAMKALTASVEQAVRSGALQAAEDIGALWRAHKDIAGRGVDFHKPDAGFARVQYSGDPAGDKPTRGADFQADVGKLESILARHTSFKPGTQRPQV
jgi:hypothetical protein